MTSPCALIRGSSRWLLRLPVVSIIVLVVVDQEPVKFVESLLCVGLLIMIKLGGSRKPLSCLGFLAPMKQRVCIGVAQTSHSKRWDAVRAYCGNGALENP